MYVLKRPFGDLPRWAIFFVYELFLTLPIENSFNEKWNTGKFLRFSKYHFTTNSRNISLLNKWT